MTSLSSGEAQTALHEVRKYSQRAWESVFAMNRKEP